MLPESEVEKNNRENSAGKKFNLNCLSGNVQSVLIKFYQLEKNTKLLTKIQTIEKENVDESKIFNEKNQTIQEIIQTTSFLDELIIIEKEIDEKFLLTEGLISKISKYLGAYKFSNFLKQALKKTYISKDLFSIYENDNEHEKVAIKNASHLDCLILSGHNKFINDIENQNPKARRFSLVKANVNSALARKNSIKQNDITGENITDTVVLFFNPNAIGYENMFLGVSFLFKFIKIFKFENYHKNRILKLTFV